MKEYIEAGGWIMVPLGLCSFIALVVILALFISLRKRKVIPKNIALAAQNLIRSGKMTPEHVEKVRKDSLLGSVLAAGLDALGQPRELMRANIQEAGRHAVHKMDRYMTTLGTIAAIAPLLGLLGTVVGMIVVFNTMLEQGGVGNPADLAGGISQALVTTAFGISIAVPALVFHRYFRGKINDYAVQMEQEASKLVDIAIAYAPQTRTAKSAATRAAAIRAKQAAGIKQ